MRRISPRSFLPPTVVATVVLVVALVLAPSQPSSSSSASPSPTAVSAKAVAIKISNYAFHPATVTVKVGTKVTVTNTDQTAHTLTARSGAFDTGTVNPGKSAHFTVTKPGMYPYYCQFHAFMSGTLQVVK